MNYQDILDQVVKDGSPVIRLSEREHIKKFAAMIGTPELEFLKTFIAKTQVWYTLQEHKLSDEKAIQHRRGYCSGLEFILSFIANCAKIQDDLEALERRKEAKKEKALKYSKESVDEQRDAEIKAILDKYKVRHNTTIDKGQPESV